MTHQPPVTPVDIEALKPMATESLEALATVAGDARARIEPHGGHVPDVLAHGHSLNAMQALVKIGRVRQEEQQIWRTLVSQPLIARVVCEDKSGRRDVYLFAPVASNLSRVGQARLASYRSPLGRIAELPIGSAVKLVSGGTGTIVERDEFRPHQDAGEWDSRDTKVEAAGGIALTVQSLRALLRYVTPAEEIDPLEAILAGEELGENVREGFRRERLERMSLREKPLLDSFQGEAFRLPLARRVLLMGPPGSGKTTTLIKRLGQKLELAALDTEERVQVGKSRAGEDGHERSWLMFSPTDLLKAYVKEAFNKEGIPAPDQNIQTWDRYREYVGRSELPILRSGTGGGGIFVLRDRRNALLPGTAERTTQWYEAFDVWQRDAFWLDLRERALRLAASGDAPVRAIGERFAALLPEAGAAMRPRIGPLLDAAGGLSERIEAIESEADRVARKAASAAFKEDGSFLLEFGRQVESLAERGSTETEDPDEEDDEEEAEAAAPRAGQQAAYAAYRRLVKQAARAAAAKRSPRPGTRLARLLSWLGGRLPSHDDLELLGRLLQAQADLRAIQNAPRRFFAQLPRRYRRFRRDAEGQGTWYKAGMLRSTDLVPLELDIVTLAMLRIAQELIEEPRIAARLNENGFEFLAACADLRRTQIVVDEATDFSPVQLACMAALCDPVSNSFFACGDFRQRMTLWGSRSLADLAWVFSDIEVKEINITYRQSRLLNEFTHRIGGLSGSEGALPLLPPNLKNEGVPPVLGTSLAGHHAIAGWLAQRISEIEQLSPPLPTVAVVVPSEDDVKPLADALNDVLPEQNLRAVACIGGRFVGEDNEIRVFDVRHIKGLEFEAVFFVGLDRLVEAEPTLFDKYLYVGATRAATYLGVTVGGASLPHQLSDLGQCFVSDWPR